MTGLAVCCLAAARPGSGGLRRVDSGVELADVENLGVALLRYDEDAGGVVESHTHCEVRIRLDFLGELAGRIDNEGHGTAMLLEVALGKGLQIVFAGDGHLVLKDGSAEVFCGLWRDLVLNVPGRDGGVAAPDMHLERPVMPEKRNPVVFGGLMDDGKGMGAGGALKIFELDDGHTRAGRGTKWSGVLHHGGLGLGVRSDRTAWKSDEEESDSGAHGAGD